MTEVEWRAGLAGLTASMMHIKESVDKLDTHLTKHGEKVGSLETRIVGLESKATMAANLPAEVHANSIRNAITEALEEERKRAALSMRGTFALIATIAGLISSVVFAILSAAI